MGCSNLETTLRDFHPVRGALAVLLSGCREVVLGTGEANWLLVEQRAKT